MIRLEEALLSIQLYLINSSAKLTKSEQKVDFKNAKGHPLSPIYLCFDSSGTSDHTALQDMVGKLAAALPFTDYPPLQLDIAQLTPVEKDWANWPQKPQFVLLHGIDGHLLGCPEKLSSLVPRTIEESTWMACPSFEALQNDQPLKSQYWKKVKQMLSL
jgi:hypothetical protein